MKVVWVWVSTVHLLRYLVGRKENKKPQPRRWLPLAFSMARSARVLGIKLSSVRLDTLKVRSR